MIRIRYCPEPFHEIELEGSNTELAELREHIRQFANGSKPEMIIAAESDYDPTPYKTALGGIRVRRTAERILLCVEVDMLVLTGKPKFLCLFADNLPWNAEHTSNINYHVHFDRAGREEHVSENSFDIVLALKR